MPVFLPEAVIMAVQPLQQDYSFEGFYAPIVQFHVNTMLYEGTFVMERRGIINALRFVTKNILAVVPELKSTIDWLNHYMTLPLANPIEANAGDAVLVGFNYRAGGSIPSLQASIVARRVNLEPS